MGTHLTQLYSSYLTILMPTALPLTILISASSTVTAVQQRYQPQPSHPCCPNQYDGRGGASDLS